MRVKASKQTIKLVIVFCIFMLLFCAAVVGKEALSGIGYRYTTGRIVSVRVQTDATRTHTRNGRVTKSRYYSVEYDTGSGTYTAEFFTILPRREGGKAPVVYDPAAPERTLNSSTLEIGFLATLFSLIVLLVMVRTYTKAPDGPVYLRTNEPGTVKRARIKGPGRH